MAYGNYAPFYRGGYFNPMQTPTMPNMAENQNQFTVPYQTPPMPTPAPSNDMIWVLGQTEAESYPVAPNATITMWDKNQDTVYIKSVNAQGVPSMEILDYTKRVQNNPTTPTEHICKCGDKYVKLEDFKVLEDKFENLTAKFEELKQKPNAKSKNKEGDE
ncbi:MAG: hypothetical protein IKV64_02675 [Clostridia bacterium]|nr:hypothetical protein [Clostridia bacterium]